MNKPNSRPREHSVAFALLVLAFWLVIPTGAFDNPLSESAIRDAYFLGKQKTGIGMEFLVKYSRSIAEFKVESCISSARLETPFTQVVEYSSRALNYSAQDAVTQFYGRRAVLRVYLDICYQANAPLPNSLRIEVVQKGKPLASVSEERESYFPPADPYTHVSNLGEKVKFEFDPSRLESSAISILIETPDGRYARCEFDLRELR